MARIDIGQLSQELDKMKTWLETQKLHFENAQKSVEKFQVDTLASFQGEAGDSVRAYAKEVYQPIHMEVMKVESELRPVLDTITNDGKSRFGDNGIVDEEYIQEWSFRFNKYAHQLVDLTQDVNRDLRSVADIIHLELLKTNELEEIHYNTKRHCQRTIEQIDEFDRETNAKIQPIQASVLRLQNMVQEVSSKAPSMSGYQSGSFKFSRLSSITPEESYQEWLEISKNLSGEELYRTAIEFGKKHGYVVEKEVNGVKSFEFSGWFIFASDEAVQAKNMVLVEIDGKLQMFCYRQTDSANTISVPMGDFENPFEALFNPDKRNKINDIMRNSNSKAADLIKYYGGYDKLPLFTPNQKIIDYYANYDHGIKVGGAILGFLGNKKNPEKIQFTDRELDTIAGEWSESADRHTFGGEITQHAVAYNLTKQIPIGDLKSRTSIADLGNDDHDITKSAMDAISNADQSIRELQQGDFVGVAKNVLASGDNIKSTAARGVEKVGEFYKDITDKISPINGIKNFTKYLGF